jgi:FMN-dependent NADH-azoreductase
MTLVVDCCIRGAASATRRYYQAYLASVSADNYTVIDLTQLNLEPLNSATLEKRNALCSSQAYGHSMFDLARQFRDAEEILIAAPFWDLAFPALLKVYLEHIMVAGLTFGYQEDGRCVGYCKAKRLLYFSSCGGYCGKCNLGFEYLKALCGMLGIQVCVPYLLEGMDIDPSKRQYILEDAIRRLPAANAYRSHC